MTSRGPRSNTEVVIGAERRYTETEFALILRQALELEERAPVRGSEGGLTLAEIQAVAREVGVDPEMVTRAASLLPAPAPSPMEKVLGGAARLRADHRSDRRLSPDDMGRVVSGLRRRLDHQGEVVEELDGVTWRSVGDVSRLFVTLRPDGEHTEVQVHDDRSGVQILTWFLTVSGFLFTGAALGNTLAPEGLLGGILYFGSFLGGGVASARALWARNAKRATLRLQDLMAYVTREVDATPTTPSPAGDALPPPATEGARLPEDAPPTPATGHPGPGPGAGTA